MYLYRPAVLARRGRLLWSPSQGLQAKLQKPASRRACSTASWSRWCRSLLVYFCFNLLYHGTNVGVRGCGQATVLNPSSSMLFSYISPRWSCWTSLRPDAQEQRQLHDRFPAPRTGRVLVTVQLFWACRVLCMPLGLLMLVFGFWFQVDHQPGLSTATPTGCSISRRTSASPRREYEAEMVEERSDLFIGQ